MTSAICKVNNQAIATSGASGIDVSEGATITISLANTAGISSWSIAATQSDDLTFSNGNLVNINNSKVQNGFSATFVMPALIGGRGSAVQFTSIVNQGSSNSDTFTFGVFVRCTNGNRLFFGSETGESNATVGNAADLNALVVSITSGTFVAGGDLTGTSSSQTVNALKGVVLSSTAPTAGQVLTATSGTAASWQNSSGGGGSPTGAAGGDLSGTYPNPTVAQAGGLKTSSGVVSVSSATAPTTGQVLTATSGTAATWQSVSSSPSGTAGGDLSGTYPNPTVAQARGLKTSSGVVSVSSATAPTTGQVLTATSGTTATWQTPAAATPLSGVSSDGTTVTMSTTDTIENISAKTQVWTAKRTYSIVGSGGTTDIFNFALTDTAVTSIDVKMVAISSVSGGAGMFTREMTFRRDGATVIAIGSMSSPSSKINNIAGANVTITNTGTQAYVNVTTPNGNTIRWFATIVITTVIN